MLKFNILIGEVGVDPGGVRLVRNHDMHRGALRICYDLWVAGDGRSVSHEGTKALRNVAVRFGVG